MSFIGKGTVILFESYTFQINQYTSDLLYVCRTVTVGGEDTRDILEEAARQIDRQDRNPQKEQEQHQDIGGQPSYIRVTPNSISVKKTKVSSQSRKRTRSESKKKS